MEAQGIPQRLYHPLDAPTTSLPDLRISGPSSANTGPMGHATKAIYVRTSTPTLATQLSHALVRRTPLSLQTICVKQIRGVQQTSRQSNLHSPNASANILWRKELANSETNANLNTLSRSTKMEWQCRLKKDLKHSCSI